MDANVIEISAGKVDHSFQFSTSANIAAVGKTLVIYFSSSPPFYN